MVRDGAARAVARRRDSGRCTARRQQEACAVAAIASICARAGETAAQRFTLRHAPGMKLAKAYDAARRYVRVVLLLYDNQRY